VVEEEEEVLVEVASIRFRLSARQISEKERKSSFANIADEY
jgi:hypothetical protein